MQPMKPIYANFEIEISVPLDPGSPLAMADRIKAVEEWVKGLAGVEALSGARIRMTECRLRRRPKHVEADEKLDDLLDIPEPFRRVP